MKPRGVVVVAMGSTSRRMLDVRRHGPAARARRARQGTHRLRSHRASSSYASGAVGSMLTDLGPRENGANDPDAALSSTFTVAEAARQAGIADGDVHREPDHDRRVRLRAPEERSRRRCRRRTTATSVFEEAGHWLEQHKDDRFLVVTRAAAPPWDVTPEGAEGPPARELPGRPRSEARGRGPREAKKIGGRGPDADREAPSRCTRRCWRRTTSRSAPSRR